MASDGTSSTPSRRGGWLRAVLIALLALLGLALGVFLWLLKSESGTRETLALLDSASGGALHAEGVRGDLAGPLHIDRLVLNNPDRRVTLEDVTLDWRPGSLARKELHIASLRIGRMLVAGKPSQKKPPSTPPASLALPLTLHLDEVRIDRGRIEWQGAAPVELGALALRLDYDSHRYRLALQRFSASSTQGNADMSGNLSGEASLADARPFAIDGRFKAGANLAMPERTIDSHAELHLSGSLTDLIARLDAAAGQASANGSALLHAFADSKLGEANLSLRNIDLSAFREGLPVTALDAALTENADGSGGMTIDNRRAGPYSEHALPLTHFETRFKQDNGAFVFERIAAALGTKDKPAGTLAGNGHYADGALTLALKADDIDLHRIDAGLHQTKLSGSIAAQHGKDGQQISLDLAQPLDKHAMKIDALAHIGDTQITLDHAEIRIGNGQAHAAGKMSLQGEQNFAFDGKVERFRPQDIGDFAQLPELVLNGGFSTHGTLKPQLMADLDFSIADSTINRHPLQGRGRAHLAKNKIAVPEFFLVAGGNRIDAHGELLSASSELQFSIAAPRLGELGAGMDGALQVKGEARGSLERPHIVAEWTASHIRAPGAVQIARSQGNADLVLDSKQPFSLAQVTASLTVEDAALAANRFGNIAAKIRYAPRPDAPFEGEIHIRRIDTPQLKADAFDAGWQGKTADHALHASLTESREQSWRLGLAGGLRTLSHDPSWQGQIEQFEADGRFAGRLVSPAPLKLSRSDVALENLALDTSTGHVQVDRFIRNANSIATRGSIAHMPLAQLLKFGAPNPALSTDLIFDANWDVEAAHGIRGHAEVKRTDGDLTLRSGAPVTLGLNQLQATLTANDERIDVKFDTQGRQLGEIHFDASAAFARHGGRYAFDSDAPVSGKATLSMPSLAWIGPLASPGVIAAGSVQGELTLGGTVHAPLLTGHLSGSGLGFYQGETGIDLKNGALDAQFDGNSLTLRRFAFGDGNGTLTAAGTIGFSGGEPDARITMTARHFLLLNRSDRKLTLSGSADLGWQETRLNADGVFTVDSAHFDVGRLDEPQLSDDVVIVGRNPSSSSRPLPANIDLDVVLGNDVTLTGNGLDAQLAGHVHLTSAPQTGMRAEGNVRVVKGTYAAYGRELAIEQGQLRFTGDLRNPALDVLAMRRNTKAESTIGTDITQVVDAGVAVRGTVVSPSVTLVSEPPVPDADKLSWLVLGKPLSSANSSDSGSLQAAATAMLSQHAANGVASQIGGMLGIDDVRVGTSNDTLQQRIVTIGKHVSSRLYVGYERALQTAGNVLSLRYALTPKLTVEAEAGARSALSLFYNIAFE